MVIILRKSTYQNPEINCFTLFMIIVSDSIVVSVRRLVLGMMGNLISGKKSWGLTTS